MLFHVHGLKDSIVKLFSLSNLIRFNTIMIKILTSYFGDTEKLLLKFIWKSKRPRVISTVLRGKNGEFIPPDFKNGYTPQQSRQYSIGETLDTQINGHLKKKKLEINPHKQSKLILHKRAKAIQWRKDYLFNKG